jgi:flagellar FliJ protein
MKKFKFRLEPLLKVKSEIEKRRQKELAEVHRRIISQKNKIEALELENLATQDSQRKNLGGTITLSEMLVYTRYFMKLKRQKISDKEMLRILDIDFEKKRQVLLAASIERKKYERLKEIHNLKHLAELSKREAKEADEFGRISHLNKSSH